MTKQEIIERLKKIEATENAHNNGYHYTLVADDWENYGKNRTYFKIAETRDGSKHYVTRDYGYYDNVKSEYVSKSSLDYTFNGKKLPW